MERYSHLATKTLRFLEQQNNALENKKINQTDMKFLKIFSLTVKKAKNAFAHGDVSIYIHC